MKSLLATLLAGGLLFGAFSAWSQQQAAQPAQGAAQAPAAQSALFHAPDITFTGKLYSPLKVSMFLPYTASITKINVQIGQKVKRGDILATYEIPMDTRMEQRTNLALTTVKDTEYKLAVNDKELDRLSAKGRELATMAQRNMASQQAVAINTKEIEAVRKEKAALLEQLALAKQLHEDRMELAEDRFGKGVGPGKLPKDGIIKAACDGYVLWLNPSLRVGIFLAKETELFQVGTVDPMIIRANVHEIEAYKIKVGDKATVTFDSIPNKQFTATVSQIPWAPIASPLQQPSYYEIELSLANPNLEFREGLKAQVTIQPGK